MARDDVRGKWEGEQHPFSVALVEQMVQICQEQTSGVVDLDRTSTMWRPQLLSCKVVTMTRSRKRARSSLRWTWHLQCLPHWQGVIGYSSAMLWWEECQASRRPTLGLGRHHHGWTGWQSPLQVLKSRLETRRLTLLHTQKASLLVLLWGWKNSLWQM